ncbi:MAG: hypothetical protein AAGF67_16830, partial [Verrucomicrobiota bacterium]
RSWYVTMASLLLMKDAKDDPLRDLNFLLDSLSLFEIPGSVAMHHFSELREAGDFQLAFEVGRRIAEEPLSDHASFLVSLSQVAGWAGQEESRAGFLDTSLQNMRARSGSGASSYFLLALTERLSLLEDDAARQQFLREVETRTDLGGLRTPSDELERDILIRIAAREWEGAIDGVSRLVQRQLDIIRPSHPDPDQVRHDQSQSWQRMRQILEFYTERIPVEVENRDHILNAFRGENRAFPSDETVIAEFERFEIDRKLLGFEWLGVTEREALVDEMHRLFLEPDSGMELARSLGNQGFHREAIPVYLMEALRLSRDYAPLQGVFESCLEAMEPGPALKLINQINAREFPSPPGLTAEYLAEQHALFLFMNRDLERLISLGRAPSGARGAPPVSSRSHLPYQAALVEAYRLMGRDDALLRLLTHFRNEQQVTTPQLFLGATILESQERYEEALEWIDAMQRDGSEPEYDRKAILKASGLHEKLGWNDSAKVVALARESLFNHPVTVTRTLAEDAYLAGAESEAIGVLKLLRRETSNRGHRSAISSQLIWLQTDPEEPAEGLAGEWEAYFQDLVYQFETTADDDSLPWSNVARFVEWLVGQDVDPQDWATLFETVPTGPEAAWLRHLLRAHFENELESTAFALLAGASQPIRNQILETLPAFGESGILAARERVEEARESGTRFFSHEPVRQIMFFHRINDRTRLLEVHQNLMREAQSDLFQQSGLDNWFPTLNTRYRLPGLFAEIGEQDLAARLFERYHDTIGTYLWNHQAFLEQYLEFLIAGEDYEKAEQIFKRVVQKTIRVDLRLLVQLYFDWGKLDQWEDRLADAQLSTGRLSLLRDWSNALAEGREMVEYSETW